MATKHGKKFREAAAKVDRAAVYTPLEAVKLVKSLLTPSSTRPLRLTSASASTPVRPIRTSVAPSPCPTAPARPSASPSSPRARRLARLKRPAPTSSVPMSSSLPIQGGEINFDAAIATPNMMAKVGRIGKILGPRGLMPNPKLGTVTMDVAKMVSELKAGRVEYRADRYGICHVPLGKKSFSEQQLVENYAALYTEILRVKPASAKGKYVKSISVSSTMGPGVKIDSAVQRNFMEA